MRRRRRERGVVLVEFALIAPLLLLLVFGVVEFGYAFSQNLDVRHGAREGARLVAVNYSTGGATSTTQSDQIIAETCNRMDNAKGATVTITRTSATVGQRAQVTIALPFRSLTGFFGFLQSKTLRSDVDIRIEDDATWVTRSGVCP